ncbi:MAG: alkaline phosphatase family protein [Gemmatimonadota bacterium]|nr:alkaline phosphatase family protein [Gemmatimonadota bacterium]
MHRLVISGDVERVIVVVLDGLRPDAITQFGLSNVLRLARNGAATLQGTTVAPSVTAAAMASLLTGADPARHGLQSDRFHLPRATGPTHPLPRELARVGLPSSGFIGHVPWMMRPVAGRLARTLGFGHWRFRGSNAIEVLATAKSALREQARGLIVMHWRDADRAGHESGWMSPRYGEAAAVLDTALGLMMRLVDLSDPRSMVVALADHGGGGRALRRHDSDHPEDRTIPIVFAGGAVRSGTLAAGTHLLDVPATILAVLGIVPPASYAGRSLIGAPAAVQTRALEEVSDAAA